MTREEVMNMLTANEDIETFEHLDGEIEVTVNDFEGFDEDWEEIEREYNEEEVEKIYNTLKENCNEYVNNSMYPKFKFENFTVTWGYASYDI